MLIIELYLAAWFPVNERTTATSISMLSNGLGGGLSYLVGPYLVPENSGNTSSTQEGISDFSEADVRYRIWWYMVQQAILSVILLIAVVIYFPSKPELPPSVSASTTNEGRADVVGSVKKILRDKDAVLCIVGFTICTGVQGAWQGIMTLIFEPLGISDQDCGKIGVIMVFVSIFPALAIPMILDRIRKQFKVSLILVLLVTTCSYVWLTLIIAKVIPFNWIQLYVSTITGGSSLSVLMPLYFEYTAEICYPVSEGIIGSVLSTMFNFSALIFFSLFFIKNIGSAWMNYLVCASCAISIPLVIFTKGRYRRSELDATLGV